ncbi:MAG: hypothetical protein ACYC4L_03930 [Chloroflexota bacterium]
MSTPGTWVQRLILGLGVLALALLSSLLSIPYVLPSDAGLGEQLTYVQTVGTYIAILVAVGLGLYAVDQVRLARQAIHDDREARESDERDEKRRILVAIRNELLHNRIVTLQYEGRLVPGPDLGKGRMLTFSSVVHDSASRGPLRGIHPTGGVVEAIIKA